MKTAVCFLRYFICCLLITHFSYPVFAQASASAKQYVDYDEEPSTSKFALYYIETSKKDSKDTCWVRKMYFNDTIAGTLAAIGKSIDENGLIKEGAFVYYFKSGQKESEGNFINNEKDGAWNDWDKWGKLTGTNHYVQGKKTGRNMKWHSNGKISDSTFLDEKGNGKSYTFYDNGSATAEGNYAAGVKNGQWTFFYREVKNQKSMEVLYLKDSAISFTCFTEEGKIQKKDCVYEREASFKGGDEGWVKYLTKKLTSEWNRYTKHLKSFEVYSVIVRFVVAQDGNIEDIRVENPRNREVDQIAMDIIQNSPNWIPAVQYNRKVKAYRRQPVTFVGPD